MAARLLAPSPYSEGAQWPAPTQRPPLPPEDTTPHHTARYTTPHHTLHHTQPNKPHHTAEHSTQHSSHIPLPTPADAAKSLSAVFVLQPSALLTEPLNESVFSALDPAHGTLHTAHCVLPTSNCIPQTTHCALSYAHCTLRTAYFELHTSNYTLCAVVCTLHTAPAN